MITKRLLSLDVFRGLTIIGMILVNSPGNQTAYAQLIHSQWNGCTFADLVFPFFIFIIGVSLVFSLSPKYENKSKIVRVIFRRTLILFCLGLLLNGFPYYDLSTLRIMGVLQRIAICYCFASLLFLTTTVRIQIFIVFILLIGYWLAMTYIPVPGFGVNNLSDEGNLASYIDRQVLFGHMYRIDNDPEGLLSTLPALATALLGVLTGEFLLSNRSASQKLIVMVIGACLGLICGWVWGIWFPINKELWTSSYVLWTTGIALFLFALCYWLIEIKQWRSWSKPLEIFGTNALLAYFLHILLLKIQNLIHIPQSNGAPGNLRLFITEHLFYGINSPRMASLLYAISYILLWLVILNILYRKRIFIRI